MCNETTTRHVVVSFVAQLHETDALNLAMFGSQVEFEKRIKRIPYTDSFGEFHKSVFTAFGMPRGDVVVFSIFDGEDPSHAF